MPDSCRAARPSISAVVSVTTTAALTLSYIATIFDRSVTVPATGIGRCSVTACWPCTSSAGLNDPIERIGLSAPHPITTGNVGNTSCSTLAVFSVVNGSSSVPAPIPTAYSRASLLVQLASLGAPSVPTASGFNGMFAPHLHRLHFRSVCFRLPVALI